MPIANAEPTVKSTTSTLMDTDTSRVSLAEILEVRVEGGFQSDEILAVLAAAAQALAGRPAASGLFSAESVFIGSDGAVTIKFLPLKSLSTDSIPPELRCADAKETDIGQPQMVWCLGHICSLASLPDFTDVGLHSLLNLMAVEHVQSRPSITKCYQMARNKMRNLDDTTRIPLQLYRELMGDMQELVDDEFCDEIRLSSTRSSLSIVSGGARRQEQVIDSPPALPIRDFQLTEINERLVVGEVPEFGRERRQSTPTPPTRQSPPPPPTNGQAKPSLMEAVLTDDDEKLDPSNPFYTPQPSPRVARSAKMEQTRKISFNESDESELGGLTGQPGAAPSAAVIVQKVEVHEVDNTTPTTTGDGKGVSSARYQTRPKLSSDIPTAHVTRRDEIEPFEEVAGIPPPDLKRLDRLYNEKPARRPSDKQVEGVSYYSAQVAATQPKAGNFSRQNSLQPEKVTRRSSRDQACAVPEFLERRPSPLVRLRAQSVKRKKVNIHKTESALVSVKLLNGQWLEVSCRTDAYVANIFDTVASHLDLSEHLFFGLAVKQDGEHFFLDNDQRLEKTAPSGWKARRSLPSHDYCLELRFRYYPKKLEFVKTENAAHQLYLQLRQDMLDGSLRIADRRRAEELAALALQAEYADPPRSAASQQETSYFKLDDYLPNQLYPSSPPGADNVAGGPIVGSVAPASKFPISQLAQQHRKLVGMPRVEAERRFVQRCQQEAAFGAHYYRVYKIKPSSRNPYNLNYSDAHLVAVMPGGLGICREQSNGARFMSSVHGWAMIRTLQFDKKRFLVATIENNIAVDHVFYTDHYTKAGYLVRFAATQHRFMIKSRFWQNTIDRVGGESPVDVGIDREFLPLSSTSTHSGRQEAAIELPAEHYGNGKSGGAQLRRVNGTEDVDYRCYGSDAVQLNITVEKHPVHGLGLTLVDGKVNDVQGVYVKSVAEVGDGKRKGLRIGDCILRVDGVSLYNKSRHDAVDLVDLVRRGGSQVELELLRFPSISEVLGTVSPGMPVTPTPHALHKNGGSFKMDKEEGAESTSERKTSRLSELSGGRSKTPPASSGRRISDFVSPPNESLSGALQSSLAKRRRQRAVSDFGAIGDQLPVLNSDDLLSKEIASLSGGVRGRRMQRRKSSSSHEFKDEETPHLSNDDEDEEDAVSRHTQIRRGEYKLPASAMYTFDNEDERQMTGDVDTDGKQLSSTRRAEDRDSLSHLPRHNPAASRAAMYAGRGDTFQETMSWSSGSHFSKKSTAFDSATTRSGERTVRRQRSTLDWTNDLSDIDDEYDGDDDGTGSRDGDERRKVFKVVIRRLEGQSSLGFQLASATGGIYVVKQISAEPALSANLRVDDIILRINDICIEGYDHPAVVQLLKNSHPSVKLEVGRRDQLTERFQQETIKVVLDKSQCRSMGLSLAKRMGHDGIFIRNIAVGSLAAEEGSLRVGDRVWAINGEDVSNESPVGCVKRLKDIDGCFEIEVKRAVSRSRP